MTKPRKFALHAALFIASAASAIAFDQYLIVAFPFLLIAADYFWQHPIQLLYLLVFCIPLSIEFQVNEGLGTDLPDEPLMLILSFISVCLLLFHRPSLAKKIWLHPLLLIVYAMLVWTFISVMFSSYPFISLKFLFAKGWYIGAFLFAPLLLIEPGKKMQRFLIALAIGMLIAVMITLLRHANTGFSFATINIALSPLYRNHVNYSALLVCTIPIWIIFYLITRRRGLLMVIAILIISLILAYSRGAWLAAIVGLLTSFLITRKKILAALISISVLVFFSVAWLSHNDNYLRYAPNYNRTIFHSDFSDHLSATYNMQDVSTAERFFRWIAGVRMVNDHGISGFGPATFYNNYREYTIPVFKTWVSNNADKSTVHNYFLLTLIEQGWPALLLLVMLAASVLYYTQQLFHSLADRTDRLLAIGIGAVFSMILTLNFLSDLIETDKIGSLFFLSISLLIILDTKPPKQPAVL